MYPRAFDYVAPPTIEEALAALTEDSKIMAGGMSLIPLMKLRLFSPGLIIDIARIPGLDDITDQGDFIEIGAMVRHADTASSPAIRAHARALGDAAALTGDVQVRNRGTSCGALAHSDVAADQPTGALVHDAVMIARSRTGIREIPAAEFFVDSLTSALEPEEILTSVRVPKPTDPTGAAYDKLGRRGGRSDYAVAGAAARVTMRDGIVTEARIAVSGVGLRPELSQRSAELLVGTDGSDQAIQSAAAVAAEDLTIVEDLYGSEEYKRHLSTVYAARSLKAAVERIT